MSSTINSVDPSNTDSMFYVYANYTYLYKGQTSIIRYNVTMLDGGYYDLSVGLSSSLAANSFQIVRFFLLGVGSNFPCVPGSAFVNYTNSTNYSYAAYASVGEVAYYPFLPSNESASTVNITLNFEYFLFYQM